MTEFTTEANTPMDAGTAKREMFHALIRFEGPQEGLISVYAKDAEHAKVILAAQFTQRKDFEIVDIYPASEIVDQDLADEVITPQEPTAPVEKIGGQGYGQ